MGILQFEIGIAPGEADREVRDQRVEEALSVQRATLVFIVKYNPESAGTSIEVWTTMMAPTTKV